MNGTGAVGSQGRAGGWAEPGGSWGDVRLELSLRGQVQGDREKQGVLSRDRQGRDGRALVLPKPQAQGEDGNQRRDTGRVRSEGQKPTEAALFSSTCGETFVKTCER